mgnify:CR=1 FL=1
MRNIFILDFETTYEFLTLPNLPYEMDQPWSLEEATKFLYGLICEALDDPDEWIDCITSCEVLAASLGGASKELEEDELGGWLYEAEEIISLKPFIDSRLINKALMYLDIVLTDDDYFGDRVEGEELEAWLNRIRELKRILSLYK